MPNLTKYSSTRGIAVDGYVEVIVRRYKHGKGEGKRYPLRGKPVRYTDPFGSVAEEDWEALK